MSGRFGRPARLRRPKVEGRGLADDRKDIGALATRVPPPQHVANGIKLVVARPPRIVPAVRVDRYIDPHQVPSGARLDHRDGKPKYLADVPRFFGYLDEVLPKYPELAGLHGFIERQVKPAMAQLTAGARE